MSRGKARHSWQKAVCAEIQECGEAQHFQRPRRDLRCLQFRRLTTAQWQNACLNCREPWVQHLAREVISYDGDHVRSAEFLCATHTGAIKILSQFSKSLLQRQKASSTSGWGQQHRAQEGQNLTCTYRDLNPKWPLWRDGKGSLQPRMLLTASAFYREKAFREQRRQPPLTMSFPSSLSILVPLPQFQKKSIWGKIKVSKLFLFETSKVFLAKITGQGNTQRKTRTQLYSIAISPKMSGNSQSSERARSGPSWPEEWVRKNAVP